MSISAFSKATFDTAGYAASRPTYPKQLFDFVFKYHEKTRGARWDTAVDLGCGTGQATVELTPFKRAIGLDPSAKMVESARERTAALAKETNSENLNRFEYVQGDAENMTFIKDGSVDLIVSAQAAHWFDWSRMWPETARVLRKGGCAAFWGYSELRFSKYPSLTPLITEYHQGSDPANSLGPHWQQPGRSIVVNNLIAIPSAQDVVPGVFDEYERVYFTGSYYPALPSPRPIIMRKKLNWNDLDGWLRTSSAFHTYHERYPEDLKRVDGDIAARFRRQLQENISKETGLPSEEGDMVEVEWPLTLILVTKA